MMILTVLPPAGLVLITLICLGGGTNPERSPSPSRTSLVLGVAIWGGILIVLTESMSAFRVITPQSVALGWAITDVVVLVLGWRTGRLVAGWHAVRRIGWPESRWARGLLVGIILLLCVELAVALVTPVNTVDALQYHLPRVLHWIQDRSLAHYPVVYSSQNARPYWAEIAILNLRILWGGDQPANLVQWGSMLYLIVLTSGITALLGGRRPAQWLGAALAASVPMGVLQSETAQNDLVSAMWAAVIAYMIILAARRAPSRLETVGLGLGVGVGLLTKGTVIIVVVPLMVWYGLARWRRDGLGPLIRDGALVALITVVLNGAFWIRNTVTYGGPYGSSVPIRLPGQGGAAPGWAAAPSTGLGMDGVASLSRSSDLVSMTVPGSAASRGASAIDTPAASLAGPLLSQVGKIARMVALNLVTPVKWVNDEIFNALSKFPALFPYAFVKTLRASAWNYEMTAASPLHLLLVLIALVGGVVLWLREGNALAAALALSVVAGFSLLSTGGCSDWIYCIRYQLPSFYLGLPLVAVVFGKARSAPWVMSTVLIVYAVPYLLFSYMRPVIGRTPWPTRVGSVFTTSQEELLFALSPDYRDEYHLLAKQIEADSCEKVGLALLWDDLEYAFWWELHAPQSGIELRYVEAQPPTDKLIDPAYQPCAIICTTCGDQPTSHGLPLRIDAGHVKLFMNGVVDPEAGASRLSP